MIPYYFSRSISFFLFFSCSVFDGFPAFYQANLINEIVS